VLYYVRDQAQRKKISINKIAYSLQKSLITPLIRKSLGACQKYDIKTLVVGGGVAANSMLRHELNKESSLKNIRVFFPPLSLCTDNAAMTAGLGYWSIKK